MGEASAWAPLRIREFRALWIALLASQTLVWAHTVGAVVVIASLGGSAAMLALVQTAVTLPTLLIALPAGVIADLVDRPRMIVLAHAWMALAVAALAALTLLEAVTEGAVLALTFALGMGRAISAPPYLALVHDVVSRAHLPAAVTLNAMALNVSRAIGPAAAGAAVIALGAAGWFTVEAVGLALCVALLVGLRLQPSEAASAQPPERPVGAMRAGMRFVRFSRETRAVLLRVVAFTTCASALWALLPAVALGPLGLGSSGLGALLACVGAGAIGGGLILPPVRRRCSIDGVVALGSLGMALGLGCVAVLRAPLPVGAALLLAGAGWLFVLSSLNTAIQLAAPAWVRGRVLAAHQMTLQGGIALGSGLWGVLADAAGLRTALLGAVGGLLLGAAAGRALPLAPGAARDMTPADPGSEPELPLAPQPEDGPVLVALRYRIDRAAAAEFVAAMAEMERIRRRDGAFDWALYEDLEEPGSFVETFAVASWEEHLRQRSRLTVSDEAAERRVRAMQRGDGPEVTHLIAAGAALRRYGTNVCSPLRSGHSTTGQERR